MNTSTTILLREWKKLSERESEAIACRDWTVLNKLLDQKNRIKDLLGDYEGDDFSGTDKQIVSELITITERNQRLLKSEMEVVRGQIQTEDRSLNNMRKVNRTYGTKDGQSYWHSYS